jgi:hypothetical protein
MQGLVGPLCTEGAGELGEFQTVFQYVSKGKGKRKVHPRTGHEGPVGE